MVFCNKNGWIKKYCLILVTILILIDGFLQYEDMEFDAHVGGCHNPYFNRWFSAIYLRFNEYGSFIDVTILILIDGFLQYKKMFKKYSNIPSHNPYFNRWFSAI